jgi:hypothetical protein
MPSHFLWKNLEKYKIDETKKYIDWFQNIFSTSVVLVLQRNKFNWNKKCQKNVPIIFWWIWSKVNAIIHFLLNDLISKDDFDDNIDILTTSKSPDFLSLEL